MARPSLSIYKSLWTLLMILTPLTLAILVSHSSLLISWQMDVISSFPISFDIILDQKSLPAAVTILTISASIFMFSKKYMASDPFNDRFTLILTSFVVSMLILIFTPNLPTLLLGWDGLGVSSFILVMYYQNPKSRAAAMLTMLTNRLGDTFIIIAIMFTLSQNQMNVMFLHSFPQTIIGWLLIIAATTKSAQIPFVSWLPAAMAAPTPVSALVHSSTLVTAGIYLLIRFSPSIHFNHLGSTYLLIVSSLTILMASLAALVENDLKKIIALSTLSQLGVMMMTLALNLPTLTFFHLLTHALFKALMFMCAGTLIMLNNHTQDLRLSSNIIAQTPIISSTLIISAMALSGFPFLAGFYSKDLILETTLINPMHFLPLIVLLSATALTATYALRLIMSLACGGGAPFTLATLNMKTTNLSIPGLSLASGAVVGGSILNWLIIQPLPHPSMSMSEKLIPPMILILGLLLTLLLPQNPSSPSSTLNRPMASLWFITPLSTQFIIKHPLNLSHTTNITLEKGWLELVGPTGLKFLITSTAHTMKKMDQINIPDQLLFGLLGFLFLFFTLT